MARKQARPLATQQVTLEPIQSTCRGCGSRMRMARHSHRTVTTLQAVTHLTVKVYRCRNTTCPRFHQATRPEEEGRWAVPHGEFGLDVIALVGALCYQEQRGIPQIHQELQRRGVQIASRTVTDQLYRYEELLALHLADTKRLQKCLGKQEQIILALDGLQPDVGHEVLWVLRDCCSGEALLARSLHFRKVTASYWDGLFAYYQVKELPRTNNGLEQYFGTARHVERRALGANALHRRW